MATLPGAGNTNLIAAQLMRQHSPVAMKKLLWKPSDEQIKQANMTRFIGFVKGRYRLNIESYDELHTWLTFVS